MWQLPVIILGIIYKYFFASLPPGLPYVFSPESDDVSSIQRSSEILEPPQRTLSRWILGVMNIGSLVFLCTIFGV
jgi:hypothetical protein